MSRSNFLAQKLAVEKYLVLDLPFSEDGKNAYQIELQQFFLHAHANKNNDIRFEKLQSRRDQGSLVISTNQKLEKLLAMVVSKSEIIGLAKAIWGCEDIYYASSFSHFRMVDPSVIEQMNYQVLHVDYGFLQTQSLNICIPATAYGRDYSGIEFFVDSPGSAAKPDVFRTIEPFVQLGQALIFPETTPHQRTVAHKTKIRLNTEFRIFPDYTRDPGNRFNLKRL